jgi:hypothetical protein
MKWPVADDPRKKEVWEGKAGFDKGIRSLGLMKPWPLSVTRNPLPEIVKFPPFLVLKEASDGISYRLCNFKE